MKILNIVLYLLVLAVIVYAVLDISSRAGFSSQDEKAIAVAAAHLDKQLEKTGFSKVRKYNYLHKQIESCKELDGFDQLGKKLQLIRALSFNTTERNKSFAAQVNSQQVGSFSLEDADIQALEQHWAAYAEKLTALEENLPVPYSAPMPYQSQVLGQVVSLRDLNNAPSYLWQLAQANVRTFSFEMEDEALNKMLNSIDCDRPTGDLAAIKIAAASRKIEPNTPYKASFVLAGEYYINEIEVSSTDGDIVYSDDKKTAKIRIPVALADDAFAGGEATKTWTATLKVPSISGYKTFELTQNFTVKK